MLSLSLSGHENVPQAANRQNPINLVNIVGLLEVLVFERGLARE
jgi:hypothetical protein